MEIQKDLLRRFFLCSICFDKEQNSRITDQGRVMDVDDCQVVTITKSTTIQIISKILRLMTIVYIMNQTTSKEN